VVPDASGTFYVVVKRQGGNMQPSPWGPVELTIAQRAPGALPVIRAEAKVVEVAGKGYVYESYPGREIAVRKGDTIRGRARLDVPPGGMLVSTSGLGVVLFDIYGGNHTLFSRQDPALTTIRIDGKILQRKTLQSLFAAKQISAFHRTSSNTTFWLDLAWIDEEKHEVVIVANSEVERANQPITVVGFESGAVRQGSRDEIVRAIRSMNPGALNSALEMAERWRMLDAVARYLAEIWVNETLPSEVRLRAAAYQAIHGDERAREFVKRTAIHSSDDLSRHLDVEDPDNDRLFDLYEFCVERLSDVIAEKDLSLIRAVLRKHDYPHVAYKVYRRLGRRAVPQLIEMLGDEADSKGQIVAAEVLGEIKAASEPAIVALGRALQSKAHSPIGCPLRLSAAVSLGQIGKPARAMLPALRVLTQDADQEVRTAALAAIEKIAR
jgi:hypothetical protein